ncbi:MAG: hypothetical protein K6G12_09775 [Lachnospiraceae bacterium]|nr:hypothetical protein [Lachnospiraceae bacterium]
MFLKQEDYIKWTDYINDRVDDPEKGGFICAENINSGPEVQFGGRYSEMLPMMAALVYGIGYHHAKSMNQVLEDIKATWDDIKAQNGMVHDGDLIIDPETGIGINPEDKIIHFAPIPDDIKKEWEDTLRRNIGVCPEMVKKLQTRDDIYDVLEECCDSGEFDIRREEGGGYNVFFSYEGWAFLYNTSAPGRLTYYSDEGVYDDCFENDAVFREIIEDLIEHAVPAEYP